MPAPRNTFKAALNSNQLQLGCWLGLASAYVAEISASAGFDWLCVDCEHAPNDLQSVIAHLQVIGASDAAAVVRPPIGEVWMIKQLLDAGAQTLLIPMIESAEQAQLMVDAVTYPPHGVRGVGSALARASNFSAIPDYLQTARDEICLLVQVENNKGLAALDDILAIEGIDGVFIGPSDLAADMGFIGQGNNPDVNKAVLEAMTKIIASGKAGGILTLDKTLQTQCLEIGASFIATEIDVTLFAKAIRGAATDAHKHLKA